jgi:hypothetical protein
MKFRRKKTRKLETDESAETKSPVLRALSTTGKGITRAECPGAQEMNFGDEDPGTRALFSTGEVNVAAEGPGTCLQYSTGKGNTRAFGRSLYWCICPVMRAVQNFSLGGHEFKSPKGFPSAKKK